MKPAKKRKPTTDAIEIIQRRHYEGHPKRIAELAEAEAKDTAARKLYELCKRAGLAQHQLAKLVDFPGSKMRIARATHWRCSGASRER